MALLKPRGCLRRLPPGFDQSINDLAEIGVIERTFDLVSRDRLKNDPGVMSDLPEFGIKLAPHFGGTMIPRPAHIQGKFRQGIEALDFLAEATVYGVTGTGLLTR